jgi:hypothetical protein
MLRVMAKESMRAAKLSSYMTLVCAAAASACGGPDETCLTTADGNVVCGVAPAAWEHQLPDSAPLNERIALLDTDLIVGSHGPEVRALHEYLTDYGYFPNPRLRAMYPRWQPIVAQPPADAELFDDTTARALLQFQAMMRVEPSGVVDEATRGVMREPRCAFPDSAPPDPREKFATLPSWTPGVAVSWGFENPGASNLSAATARQVVIDQLEKWKAATTINFVDTGTNGNILVKFQNPPSGASASTALLDSEVQGQAIVRLAPGVQWSTADAPPSPQVDIVHSLLHELGHANGLHHSLGGPTIMTATNAARDSGDQQLKIDDRVGISQLFDTWSRVTSATASQIDVNGSASSLGVLSTIHVWIIAPNGLVRKWNGGNLFTTTTNSLPNPPDRIAVSRTGVPWVIVNQRVWKLSNSDPATGTWSQVAPTSQCALDIDIGSDGSGEGTIWIAGCSELRRRSGTSWEAGPAVSAARVGVDSRGTPWFSTTQNVIRRLSTNSLTASVVSMNGRARDIDAGPGFVINSTRNSGYAYCLGDTLQGSGYGTYLWNEQPELGSPSSGSYTPPRQDWLLVNSLANSIAVAPDGQPWIVDDQQRVMRRSK